MHPRHIVLLVACAASVASVGGETIVWDDDEWLFQDTGAPQEEISLRAGQTQTWRVELITQGSADATLFVDLQATEMRGTPSLLMSLGWPEHVEDTTTGPVVLNEWSTVAIEDALRGCEDSPDTGWSPPAEVGDGVCTATVDLTVQLSGEGNVIFSATPLLSTPFEEGMAWVGDFYQVD